MKLRAVLAALAFGLHLVVHVTLPVLDLILHALPILILTTGVRTHAQT